MTTINVQFSNSTETTIISYFGSPQDPVVYPNFTQIDTSDPRWKAYYDAQPAFVRPYLPAPTA